MPSAQRPRSIQNFEWLASISAMSNPMSSSDVRTPWSANSQIDAGCGVNATAGGSPPSTRMRSWASKSFEPVNSMVESVASL